MGVQGDVLQSVRTCGGLVDEQELYVPCLQRRHERGRAGSRDVALVLQQRADVGLLVTSGIQGPCQLQDKPAAETGRILGRRRDAYLDRSSHESSIEVVPI